VLPDAFCSASLTQDNAAIVGGERLRACGSYSRDHAWITPLGGCHPGVVLLAWYEHQGGATRGALPAGSVTLLRPGRSGHDCDG
jgi:hypothetical protein